MRAAAPLALATCVAALACGPRPHPASGPVSLLYVGSVPGTNAAADTVLLMPSTVAAARGVLAVADAATPDVRLLRQDGALLLRLGRKGQGPGEFLEVRGVALAPDGRIAATDPRNRRVSVFAPDGALRLEIPLHAGRLGEPAFDARGRLHIDRSGPVRPGQPAGGPTVGVHSPDGPFLFGYGDYRPSTDPFADAFENEARFAPDPEGGMWLLYAYRGTATLYRDGKPVREIRAPPPRGRPVSGPYTEPVPGYPGAVAIVRMPAAHDIATDDEGRVYLLVFHTPPGEPASAELFAYAPDGRPLGSAPLARPARRIAVGGARLYALRWGGDERPQIDLYDLGPAAAPRR